MKPTDEELRARMHQAILSGMGPRPAMERTVTRAKKEMEAVKSELELEVKLELSVRNGHGGRTITRWMVINQVLVELAKLKVEPKPLLSMSAQQAVPATLKAFIDGHGQMVVQHLQALQIRAVKEGLVEVMVDDPDQLPDKPRLVVK
jgi:hypothetical protein